MTYDASYFQTMAQVIPVFWLVLLVEFRLGRREESPKTEQIIAAIALPLAAGGELLALWQMTRDHPSGAAGLLVFVVAMLLVDVIALTTIAATNVPILPTVLTVLVNAATATVICLLVFS